MASPEDPRCHAHLSLRRGALAIGSRISDAVEASSKKQSLASDGKKISGEGNGEREAVNAARARTRLRRGLLNEEELRRASPRPVAADGGAGEERAETKPSRI